MVENKNISGADEKILFPYINDPNPVQQVGHPTDIGYEKVKDFNEPLNPKEVCIIKNVSILAGSTLILDEKDLCLVDLQTFGLKIKLGESTHTASVLFKLVGGVSKHINEGENRTSY